MSTVHVTGASPAREVALQVLLRFEGGAWVDRALVGEARKVDLDPRDVGLARRLAFGAVQQIKTLDHLVGAFTGRKPTKLDAPVRAILRLGLYQIAYTDRIPDHAAVGESVELAKRHAPRAAGLVNATLRRATREAAGIVAALPQATPEQAALKHSYPAWIAQRWWAEYGPEEARALLAAGNRAPETALRANTLKTTRDDLAAALGDVVTRPAPGLPDALVVETPFDLHGHHLYGAGLYVAQSRAAQAVARALDPQPGDRVLDLCAAPGGKTSHLAALAGNAAEIVAVEADAKRAQQLGATLHRLGARAEVRHADATTVDEPAAYDCVLVDPPCTDLGTLALRPDARWRKQPQDAARLATLQLAILEAGARALRPGGTLVYSTCTISPPENADLVATFLSNHPDFVVDPIGWSDLPVWNHEAVPAYLQTLPHRDGTDGFFVARLRRSPA